MGKFTIGHGRRAAAGAELLDRLGPADWYRRVDLVKLDIADPAVCVLGQVYGDGLGGVFNSALDALGLTGEDAHVNEYGFDLDEDNDRDWEGYLEAAWRHVIGKRLGTVLP